MLVKVRINYLFTTPVMKDAFNLLQIGFRSDIIKIFNEEEYYISTLVKLLHQKFVLKDMSLHFT